MGQRTPLYYPASRPRQEMVDFGGWDMPRILQVEEHHEVRRDCGGFWMPP